MKKCAIIGQNTPKFSETDKRCADLKSALKSEIVRLIAEEGVTHFSTGMSVGAEMFAAEIVLDLKTVYESVTLECVIPFEAQAEKWSERLRDRYFGIIERCDKEVMMQKGYSLDCISKHGRQLVDGSDFVILAGDNTDYLGKYAKQQGKTVLYIMAYKSSATVLF